MIFRKKCPSCGSYQTRKEKNYADKTFVCDNCKHKWSIRPRCCPGCGSFRIEKYDNHGTDEWICNICGEQWQYDKDGGVTEL